MRKEPRLSAEHSECLNFKKIKYNKIKKQRYKPSSLNLKILPKKKKKTYQKNLKLKLKILPKGLKKKSKKSPLPHAP